MTLSEFKAWFEGFTEEMDGPPTKKQWSRIRKRVLEIDDVATSYPVFIERYYRPWQPYWTNTSVMTGNATQYGDKAVTSATFNTAEAFTAAGKAEFRKIESVTPQ